MGTSTAPITQPLIEPGDRDILRALKLEILSELRCFMPGQISSFDATKMTANISIMGKRVLPDGTLMDYPGLVDCPVFTLQGGGAVLEMPIQAGDYCVVIFSDRNLDTFMQTGGAQPPATGRMHDFSDGIALVGLKPLTAALLAYSSTEARLAFGGAKVGIQGGLVTVQNGTQNLLTILTNILTALIAPGSVDAAHDQLAAGTITTLTDAALALAALLY